jgi:hypothetical protein
MHRIQPLTSFFILFSIFMSNAFGQKSIAFNHEKDEIRHVISLFIKGSGKDIEQKKIGENADIKVFTQDDIGYWTSAGIFLQHFSEIEKDGYAYKWSAEKKILYILALESSGAVNGILDLNLELANLDFYAIEEKVFKPTMEYRIIKFNLPWSPYRDNEATTLHY